MNEQGGAALQHSCELEAVSLPGSCHVAPSPSLPCLWLFWKIYFYLSLLKMNGEGRGVSLL